MLQLAGQHQRFEGIKRGRHIAEALTPRFHRKPDVFVGEQPLHFVDAPAVEGACLNIELGDEDMDTVAGVLMARAQRMPVVGDKIRLNGSVAEILEVQDDRATRIQFTLETAGDDLTLANDSEANQAKTSP